MAISGDIEKLERRWIENPSGLMFAPLAEAHRKAGNHDRALEILELGLAEHPEYVPALIVRGRCLLDAEQFEQAEGAFEQALGRDPVNPIALRCIAEVYEHTGRPEEAVERLELLLEVDRGDSQARDALERVRAAAAQPPEVVPAQSEDESSAPHEPLESFPEPKSELETAVTSESGSELAEDGLASPERESSVEPQETVVEESPWAQWQAPSAESSLEPPASYQEPEPKEPVSTDEPWAEEASDVAELETDTELEVEEESPPVAQLIEAEPTEEPEHAPEPTAEAAPLPADEAQSVMEAAAEQATEAAAEQVTEADAEQETEAEPELMEAPVSEPEPSTGDELPEVDSIPVSSFSSSWASWASWGETPAPAPEPPSLSDDESEAVVAEDEPVPTLDDSAEPEETSPGLIITESMAELFLQQGHRELALAVYRQLVSRPDHEHLRERITALEAELDTSDSPPVREEADARQSFAAAITGGRSVAERLQEVLEAPPPSVKSHVHPPAIEQGPGGEPTRESDRPFSLATVFGESSPAPGGVAGVEATTPEPALETGQAASDVDPSYDEFFGGGPPEEADEESGTPTDGEDLHQFNEWLKGLKR